MTQYDSGHRRQQGARRLTVESLERREFLSRSAAIGPMDLPQRPALFARDLAPRPVPPVAMPLRLPGMNQPSMPGLIGRERPFFAFPRPLRNSPPLQRPGVPPQIGTHAVPLTDLGEGTYRGFQGGLYPGGSNHRPPEHEQAGLERAQAIEPLDRQGRPDDQGQIVLLSIGMSNTSMEFEALQGLVGADPTSNPNLTLVNGAQGGMAANTLLNSRANLQQFWRTIDARLARAGVTSDQVQVIWIKQADAGPQGGFPNHALALQRELEVLSRMLNARFPNLQQTFVSSRTFGGHSRIPLNPEPFAFESGFAVKWLIEDQIQGSPALNFDPARGPVEAPWLSWGPYLWANGPTPRADGLAYSRADFAADGVHPSPVGAHKVARQLLDFFQSDTATQSWFLAP
ncbi:hypothetical protein BH23PLA1_BH23PLA1_03190 [soil metagenome]